MIHPLGGGWDADRQAGRRSGEAAVALGLSVAFCGFRRSCQRGTAMKAPSLVRARKCWRISVSSRPSQVGASTCQSRDGCASVSRSPGISSYSARTRVRRLSGVGIKSSEGFCKLSDGDTSPGEIPLGLILSCALLRHEARGLPATALHAVSDFAAARRVLAETEGVQGFVDDEIGRPLRVSPLPPGEAWGTVV